jgi:hypothetical protein
MVKERSLIWKRSRVPVGNYSTCLPGTGNGTVRDLGQWLWESLTYSIADFQSCSFDMASDSGEAVDMHQHNGHGSDARACGRHDWKGPKNSE